MLTDYDEGIGRELQDLRGIAVLCRIVNVNRGNLDLDQDDREDLLSLVAHSIDRLNAKVHQVEAAQVQESREEA